MPDEWEEVDWITGDTMETLSYRHCDFCYESFLEDCWASKETRKFHRHKEDGLIACEHCLPVAMADEPILV